MSQVAQKLRPFPVIFIHFPHHFLPVRSLSQDFPIRKDFRTQDLVSKRVDNRVALRLGGGMSNVWIEQKKTLVISIMGFQWEFLENESRSAWYTKQPLLNGSFSWMIPKLYIQNGCFTKNPLKNGLFGVPGGIC